MACKIGITTKPKEREIEKRIEYPTLYKWKILYRRPSATQARADVIRRAERDGCQACLSGRHPKKAPTYHVYKFEY